MHHALQHRFRIFLHLLKVLETLPPALASRDWAPALIAEALDAEARREMDDWLGYETVLFRVAALTLHALEEHHRRTDSHQAPAAGPRWPDLDPDQKRAFQGLQEGLMRAFLEQEGAGGPGEAAAAS
jgi:hypothetical protein